MEAIQTLTPVQILMISQTFVVLADGEAQPEEKESISVMFRKHVTRNEISDQQLQRLTSYAFNYADTHTFEEFLREARFTRLGRSVEDDRVNDLHATGGFAMVAFDAFGNPPGGVDDGVVIQEGKRLRRGDAALTGGAA